MFHWWERIARRGVLNRRLTLAVCLPLLALGYAGLVLSIGDDLASAEQRFAAEPGTGAGLLDVYVTLLSIDPVNEAAHLRLYVTSRDRPAGAPALKLRLDDGYAVQELAAAADSSAPPAAIEISMDGGRAAAYPLERFRARLRLSAQDASSARMPVRLTVWEGIAGWKVRATQEPAGSGETGEIRVRLAIRRSLAVAVLALAIYGTMALIGAASLTVGALVFARVRKLEATMASFLSGMLFALPAMRYALPGSPPLGVALDQLVFMWAELAAALGLLLFVLFWALRGPSP